MVLDEPRVWWEIIGLFDNQQFSLVVFFFFLVTVLVTLFHYISSYTVHIVLNVFRIQ